MTYPYGIFPNLAPSGSLNPIIQMTQQTLDSDKHAHPQSEFIRTRRALKKSPTTYNNIVMRPRTRSTSSRKRRQI